MPFVEEINWKSYNPDVYFTSVNAAGPSGRNRITKTTAASGVRNNKRVNYSLPDLEAKIYAQRNGSNSEASNSSAITTTSSALDRYTPEELLKSRKRFMELDTENVLDIKDVSYLMSSVTGISKDRIDSSSGSNSSGGASSNVNRSHRNKFELPKNMELMYRSTKPPVPKKKNTNRVVALKKTLSSRRPLTSYLDALDQVNRSIIFNNVYNKKFFKVLPVITICSICGGYNSISGCVRCGNKICSLRCFNLHNEARCTM
ncbi:Vps71p [Lachancea thermotolerans CBS 6340]|uniref:KLTH0G03256p n=1 Tax=Lachancea thermotolerans (strain ATCC 56472 / CBS 6340 / NRRL Y-8284) TaxID=559295 RepID=C5DLT3_LACTC|nr:KLTH0G03256p [Lachancea thermotolerans CBS 6340]CAR24744.1 KLTH0G03256p [Lachancea thermotolerans CBS 6340]